MELNGITSELQCYVDLSLFDSFTGESFSKDFLTGDDKNRVTACEEAIKLLNGADEASLAMLKDVITKYLTDIRDLFKECNEKCEADHIPCNQMNLDAQKGFEAALALIGGEINPEKIVVLDPEKDYHAVSTITAFDCTDDLSQYTDSLLFESGESIATMTVEDGKGHFLDMELMVRGEVNIVFNDESCRHPDEFPPELVQAIKDGKENETFTIESNNWFELMYTLTDANGKELACDGDVWESQISTMTAEQLKAEMYESGAHFMEFHIGREPDEPEI